MSLGVWTFPFPTGVNVNHSYVGMGKRRKLSDAAYTWREEARLIVRLSPERVAPPFSLIIGVSPPIDKVKRDLDGILKQTIDAIFLELGYDDRMEVLQRITLQAEEPSDPPKIIAVLITIGERRQVERAS